MRLMRLVEVRSEALWAFKVTLNLGWRSGGPLARFSREAHEARGGQKRGALGI